MKRAIFLLTALSAGCAGMADIRPESLKAAPPSPSAESLGRRLVSGMMDAHGGLDRWRSFNFIHARAQDEWFSKLFFALAAPYTENPEQVVLSAYTQKFPSARIEFPGGKNAGHTWVVEEQTIRMKEPNFPPQSKSEADDRFFATFVHNFLLWPNVPFLLATADKAVHIGEAQWEGRSYDKVLIAWGDYAPQANSDQWILWINQESHLLERVWFTIRMAGERQVGGYNLREFHDVQGMKIATVYEGLLDLDDDPLHTYTYSKVEFSNRQEVDLMVGAP